MRRSRSTSCGTSRFLNPPSPFCRSTNFEAAAAGIAATTLRAVIGGIPLDDVLSQREHINNMLRTRLDEVTERWGVKVTNVEIREIVPPRDVQDAMNRQMSAERIRRAVVTESTGTREAAVNVAEGEKQAAILRAEGQKQSAILEAEGEQSGAVELRRKVLQELLKRSTVQPRVRGSEDHDATILRNAQVYGHEPIHQVHLPNGIYQHVG
jgi:regulator of protease activity HflC (stomatin/prohibitin superfamily)